MKQLFLFLTPLIFLAFGCTDDNSGNTTVVPLAPTNLSRTVVSNTQVKLNWTDNATNEAGYKIQRKTGNGNFADIASTGADITTHDDLGLTANTTYTYRVYAFNNAGNSIQYSNEVTLTTNGSAVNLPSVTIGTQVWTTKNLDVVRYRNSDLIPQVRDSATWENLTTGAWCWYNNDSATYGSVYGRLYNWYAVNDPRGLAPAGWHVPTDFEWTILTTFLGGEFYAGGPLKSAVGWNVNTATNSTGFSALPGGMRYRLGSQYVKGNGYWWTATLYNTTQANHRQMGGSSTRVERGSINRQDGLSVRLIKD